MTEAKKVSLHYFKKNNANNQVWDCKICEEGGVTKSITQKPGSGWTNTFNHVKSQHPEWKEVMKEKGTPIFAIPPKVMNTFHWLEFIVMKNLPLSFVDDDLVRNFTRYDSICRNTLKEKMDNLCCAMEGILRKELPTKFGIIFDGWSEGSDHYVALFACYDSNGATKTPLLSFQPIPDYGASTGLHYALTAKAHKEFIDVSLNFYGRSGALIFLVGDNCSTNKALATLCKVPLVGCGSHRLNLAVTQYLEEHEPLLKTIHDIMVKLSTIKLGAKLLRETPLHPVQRNATRWSSTFSMIKRFIELKDILEDKFSEDFELPARAGIRKIGDIFENLKNFESVSKKLQKEKECNILTQRQLFDGLIELYPSTKEYLAADAPIVHSPEFEAAVCKVLLNSIDFDESEEEALSDFMTDDGDAPANDENDELAFAEKIIKKHRKNPYVDLSYIPPTSNLVERFFSAASFVMTDLRKRNHPRTLEMLMFLKFNRDMWNQKVLNSAYNTPRRTD
jgi:hypothetical protein